MRNLLLAEAVLAMTTAFGGSSGLQYKNPLGQHEAYDVTWMKASDGFYYLTSTEREVLKSSDFVKWQLVADDFFSKETLDRIHKTWPNIWAPKIMDFDGKGDYRIYVAHNRDDRHSAIFVYTSQRPEGPYGNGRLIVDGSKTGIRDTIDPEVVRDPETGKWWLFYGSIDGDYLLELSADGLSAATGDAGRHIAGLKREQSVRRWCVYEGTSIVQRGGWWYYLAGAGEWWTRNYRIVCGRSRSLTGPYLDREGHPMTEGYVETIAQSGDRTDYFSPGHPSELFTNKDGRTYLFHFCNSNLDWKKGKAPAKYFRPLMLSEVTWTEDGWPRMDFGRER